MTRLVKSAITTYIPGNPGNPGSPYVPAQPARTVVEQKTVCQPGGYTTTIVQASDGSYYILQSSTPPQCAVQDVLVYYPATAAIDAVPYSPPTPAQISVSLNQGWNSYATSIGELSPGSYIEFTVKPGTYGALMAIGVPNMEGRPLADFKYGIMVDASGIYSFEAGVAVPLGIGNSSGLRLRIGRLADGRIVYSIGTTVVKISASSAYGVYEQLHAYGMLYSAYDEVSSAAFATANLVAEGSAVVAGAGGMTAKTDPRVSMGGAGGLLVSLATAVMLNGSGTLNAQFSHNVIMADAQFGGTGALVATLDGGGHQFATMLALQSNGSDYDTPGVGYASLPMMTASGAGDYFAVAVPTVGYGNLPFMTAWALGSDTDFGTASENLPMFLSLAAESAYGLGDASMPMFATVASGGFIPDNAMWLMSAGVAQTMHTMQLDLLMVLDSSGSLVSSQTMTRAQVVALMSTLRESDSLSLVGIYGYSVMSDMRGITLQTMSAGGRADLHDSGVVWVVNTETRASSQYDGYGFNSFFKRGNTYFGVAADGIYQLDGATDAGADVNALAYLGRLDFATALKKLMPNAYLAASSDAPLQLEVDADGKVYSYTARDSGSGAFKNHRVDMGRGLKASTLGLTIKNKNGADFELASVDLLQAPSARRI